MTLCGEIARQPLAAMALLGIGFRSLSMAPAAIGPVKAMLLGLDVGALTKAMDEVLDDHHALMPMREVLARFAESHNIPSLDRDLRRIGVKGGEASR